MSQLCPISQFSDQVTNVLVKMWPLCDINIAFSCQNIRSCALAGTAVPVYIERRGGEESVWRQPGKLNHEGIPDTAI